MLQEFVDLPAEVSRLSGSAVAVAGPGYEFDQAGGWLRYLDLVMAVFFGALGAFLRPDPGPVRRKWAIALVVGFVVGIVGAILWL